MNSTLDQHGMTSTHNLSPLAIRHMRKASGWMKFLAIFGFIFSALLALGGIATMSSPLFGTGMMIFFIVMALIGFFFSLFLFQSASRFRKFADEGLDADADYAFIKLNTLFTFAGVTTIIYVVVVIIAVASGSVGDLLLENPEL